MEGRRQPTTPQTTSAKTVDIESHSIARFFP